MVAKGKGNSRKEKKEIVFVTGATGRLGRSLVQELIKNGNEVRALVKDRENMLQLPSGALPYLGNIADRNVLDSGCRGADVVYHLAAIVSEVGMTDEILRVNVEGTKNILDAAAKGKVKRIIYTSSVDVYGVKRKERLDEEASLEPQDRYGYSKTLAEREIIEHKPRVPYTIFRISTMYGNGFEHSFFKVFKALKDRKVVIIGKGSNRLTVIHVSDVIKAFMLAKDSEEAKNQIFNLSDGNLYTQEELIGIAADALQVPRPSMHLNELIIKVIAKRRGLNTDELRFLTSDRNIDISKARKVLGFKPRINVASGIKELVAEFSKAR